MICDIEHFLTKGGVNIWTARGKMFMKSVKDTSKCLLSFSETHYILNSQSYLPMKFYPLKRTFVDQHFKEFCSTNRILGNYLALGIDFML